MRVSPGWYDLDIANCSDDKIRSVDGGKKRTITFRIFGAGFQEGRQFIGKEFSQSFTLKHTNPDHQRIGNNLLKTLYRCIGNPLDIAEVTPEMIRGYPVNALLKDHNPNPKTRMDEIHSEPDDFMVSDRVYFDIQRVRVSYLKREVKE